MTSAEYKKKYEKLSAKAGAYDVNEFTNELERRLQENANYNKDLYDQENELRQEQLGIGARLRDEYYNSPIRNALAQENLIAQARANTGARLGTVQDLLGERRARFNDIIAKAVGAYQSAGERARLQAEEMWRMFTNQQGLEEAARNRGGGGGEGVADIKALIEEWYKKDKETKTTPAMPYEQFFRTNPVTQQTIQGPIQIKDGKAIPLWKGIDLPKNNTVQSFISKLFGR